MAVITGVLPPKDFNMAPRGELRGVARHGAGRDSPFPASLTQSWAGDISIRGGASGKVMPGENAHWAPSLLWGRTEVPSRGIRPTGLPDEGTEALSGSLPHPRPQREGAGQNRCPGITLCHIPSVACPGEMGIFWPLCH